VIPKTISKFQQQEVKGKAILYRTGQDWTGLDRTGQDWTGPEVFKRFKLPDFEIFST